MCMFNRLLHFLLAKSIDVIKSDNLILILLYLLLYFSAVSHELILPRCSMDFFSFEIPSFH